ncbi:MAG: DUF1992 domain-containing protein, partial [Chloroflexota bacterium]|nr:DUF1992 domain-containing protein [Chloroflexota bacterium]
MSFERIAEEKIREAIDQGAFTNVKGMGRPLASYDDELAGDDWIGLHVLRQNGFLPEWLELRRQAHIDKPKVRAAMIEWERAIALTGSTTHALAIRAGENYRKIAAAVNASIDLHNIRCPSIHLELVRHREDARPA